MEGQADCCRDLVILYDQQCPFCHVYIRYSRFRQQFPEAQIISAREDSDARRKAEARGHNINDGMVVIVGDQMFHGADAMNRLALITTNSSLFNRMTRAVIANKATARTLYPLFNTIRKIPLFALGRKQIDAGEAASP